MKKSIITAIVVVAVLATCVICFFLGDKYGVEHMAVVTATPTDLAQTMLQDEFYSTYRERTIMTTGKIVQITRADSQAVVRFPTESMYQAKCRFNASMPKLKVGQTITVLAEGAQAERQSTAVQLDNCILVR